MEGKAISMGEIGRAPCWRPDRGTSGSSGSRTRPGARTGRRASAARRPHHHGDAPACRRRRRERMRRAPAAPGSAPRTWQLPRPSPSPCDRGEMREADRESDVAAVAATATDGVCEGGGGAGGNCTLWSVGSSSSSAAVRIFSFFFCFLPARYSGGHGL